MEKCCETCRWDLGGGYNNCRINLEAECAAGDYDAWESRQTTKGEEHEQDDHHRQPDAGSGMAGHP